MYRVAFNPDLPVVAASPFNAGEKSFSAGDVVDWRALGVSEWTLGEWWRAQLVVHPLEAVTAPVSAQASEPRAPGKSQRHARR